MSEILRALKILFAEGETVEVRLLPPGKASGQKRVGYYRDFEKLAKDVETFDQIKNAKHNSYVVLNTCDPGLFARSPNKIAQAGDTSATSDQDVLRRKWLLVDCDPRKPSGVSSADHEHENALNLAQKIKLEMTRDFGWPEPIMADSGNGAHLLYRIDLLNTGAGFSESLMLVTSVLNAFSAIYSNDNVEVDTKNRNASRICKLYGTMTRKGNDVPGERPWRRSKLLSVPDNIVTVTTDQLKHLASLYEDSQVRPSTINREPEIISSGGIDMSKWLAEHDIAIHHVKDRASDGSKIYVLENCPWNPEEHTDHSAYVTQFPSGAIAAGCHHNGCDGKGWPDLRKLYEPVPPSSPQNLSRGSGAKEDLGTLLERVDGLPLNSQGDVDRLYALHHGDLAYVTEFRSWMCWDGRKWNKSETAAYSALIDVIALIKQQAQNLDSKERAVYLSYAEKKGSARMFRDTLDLASHDPRFVISTNQLDSDPLILNTESGVIDLKTLEIENQTPEMYLTKTTGYAYDPMAKCPRFLVFLNEIFAGDQELILYVQRLMGYCLTGLTREKSFYIFYGPEGDNGKSVLLALFGMVCGTYSKTASIDTFMYNSRKGDARDDLVNLKGVRVIQTSEPEENSRFAMGLMKNYSGSTDKIACRPLYGVWMEYTPTGKILIATNNRPKIFERTDAAWNRIHIIPFDVKIPEERQNKNLLNELVSEELAGILNWALDGLMEYYRLGGLYPTQRMRILAQEYRRDNDSIRMFFEECCLLKPDVVISNSSIYKAYSGFCRDQNVMPVGSRKFADAFGQLGKKHNIWANRGSSGKMWYGVTVRA